MVFGLAAICEINLGKMLVSQLNDCEFISHFQRCIPENEEKFWLFIKMLVNIN